jgi:hypothetical protein
VSPLNEAECGFFHLSGANNAFFIRYQLANTHMEHFSDSLLQARPFNPFSIRIFCHLNNVSSSIKRSLYHQAKSELVTKSFRVAFSYEAFYYFLSRVRGSSENGNGVLYHQFERNQQQVIYHDTLIMKSVTTLNSVYLIRFFTKQSLNVLRKVLGTGIGVGLAKSLPTKAQSEAYCCINDKLLHLKWGIIYPHSILRSPCIALILMGLKFVILCRVNFCSAMCNTQKL